MDDVLNPLQRDVRRGLELEDAIGLLGPAVVVPHQVRDEAARFAQPLGVGETVVGPPELLLGALAFVNVDKEVYASGRCARWHPEAEIRETETSGKRRRNVDHVLPTRKGGPTRSRG